MHRSKCPEIIWDFGIEYVAQIRERISQSHIDNQTPLESTTGETPDLSKYLEFGFCDWIKFHDTYNSGNENKLGRWLGNSENILQAMCYYVLKGNGKILLRSTVCPLLHKEYLDESEKDERAHFDSIVAKMYGDFDETLIQVIPNDEMVDPIFPDDSMDEPSEIPVPSDTTSGVDEFSNAEIYLPHGDRNEIAKVLWRKRNLDGNFIGRRHTNPMLDSRVFTVEFPDGEQQDVAFNVLAEHLYSQVDVDGKQYQLFKAIVNHRNTQTRS